MEQRRLRLGDILDDYCPRERRVTNHAVVAMIEEDIKQTRCTTCDAEHAYKGGKAPRQRKKETPAALYKEVLAGMSDETVEAHDSTPQSDESSHDEPPTQEATKPEDVNGVVSEEPDLDPEPSPAEEGPVHRPLIRATLPRPEGQKDTRPVPEFTVRHSGNRPGNGNYRERRMRRGAAGGNVPRGPGGQRFAGSRGNGRGPGGRDAGGFRASQQPRHGGKKRSR
jgi:hypothetical protein